MRTALSITVLVGLSVVSSTAFAQTPRPPSAERRAAPSAESLAAPCPSSLPSNPYAETDETRNPYAGDSSEVYVEPNPYRLDSDRVARLAGSRQDGCALALAGADNPYLEEVEIEANPYVLASFTVIDRTTEPNPYY